jgi:predicted glycoside hydrolase/deacetylase ChbG (UPF0249 family)
MLEGNTWAEKLGYPKDKQVLILHADDIGMCKEANESVKPYLLNDNIQSAAVMVPCPYFDEFADWYKNHPSEDVGLHLTLTSEWQKYRWGPVSAPETVPSLIDPDGFLWHEVPDVVQHASAEEVETEIRAQIEHALSKGINPSHIDTHMGTLFGTLDYTKSYLNIAMEYGIPAMVIEFTEEVTNRFREEGYPITDELIEFSTEYSLPKLDDFQSVAKGDSYADKKQKFYQLVRSLKPGLTEIIFHPSIESENLKSITNSWQQRVWEAQMFSDPDVIQFFKDEDVLFTNWIDVMKRFNERI